MLRFRPGSKYLFYSAMTLFLVFPFAQMDSWAGVALRIGLFLTLLTALWSVADRPAHLFAGGFLVAMAVLTNLLVITTDDGKYIPISLTCVGLFAFLVCQVRVQDSLRSSEVSAESLYSAVTAYMVAAVGFACLFQLCESAHPGSFEGTFHPNRFFPGPGMSDMIYFSICNLTNTGHSGIMAIDPLARNLANLEMLFGTLYPTIILARLVGLHTATDTLRQSRP